MDGMDQKIRKQNIRFLFHQGKIWINIKNLKLFSKISIHFSRNMYRLSQAKLYSSIIFIGEKNLNLHISCRYPFTFAILRIRAGHWSKDFASKGMVRSRKVSPRSTRPSGSSTRSTHLEGDHCSTGGSGWRTARETWCRKSTLGAAGPRPSYRCAWTWRPNRWQTW